MFSFLYCKELHPTPPLKARQWTTDAMEMTHLTLTENTLFLSHLSYCLLITVFILIAFLTKELVLWCPLLQSPTQPRLRLANRKGALLQCAYGGEMNNSKLNRLRQSFVPFLRSTFLVYTVKKGYGKLADSQRKR